MIRDAKESDADALARVLVASIRELCLRDHGGDGPSLDAWLANKTLENVRLWLENRDNVILVAEIDGRVAAVGGVRTTGTAILNYVAPAYRFRGVSKAMMSELERRVRRLGLSELALESTQTARDFYLSLGYADLGSPSVEHGLGGLSMVKGVGGAALPG